MYLVMYFTMYLGTYFDVLRDVLRDVLQDVPWAVLVNVYSNAIYKKAYTGQGPGNEKRPDYIRFPLCSYWPIENVRICLTL